MLSLQFQDEMYLETLAHSIRIVTKRKILLELSMFIHTYKLFRNDSTTYMNVVQGYSMFLTHVTGWIVRRPRTLSTIPIQICSRTEISDVQAGHSIQSQLHRTPST